MKVSRQEFEQMIVDALAAIPARFRDRLDNLAFTLEDRPTPEQRREFRMGPDDYLLGLYQGVPNTLRGADYGNVLPDKIIIYQEPLSRLCPDLGTLRQEIRKTVWHEVGHYFGLDDVQLRRLEREARNKTK
jgi:predicted Zn-dependent protease with MMP-like domain